MKKLLLLVVLASVLNLSYAQITIDGTITESYYRLVATGTENSRDGFGADNEMGKLWFYSDNSTLYVGISGKINANNNIVVFMDNDTYTGRGTAPLAGSAGSSSSGVFTTSGGGLDQARMDAGFDADYAFAFNEGNSATNFFLDAARFNPSSDNNGYNVTRFVGNSGSQSGGSGSFSLGLGGTGNITFAYNSGYTTGSNLGIEFAIPYTALPGFDVSDKLKFFVVITNNTGFVSNESIPGDIGGSNPGNDPDLSGIAGTLYTNDVTLPVKFTSITGRIENNRSVISWTIAEESNVAHYELEESNDGIIFTKAVTVQAASRSNYSATDNKLVSGRNYYRVKAVDIDGKSTYSKVISLLYGVSTSMEVFPNPAKDQLTMKLYNLPAGPLQIQLLNTAGQQVYRQIIQHDGTNRNLAMALPTNLGKGQYMLIMLGGTERRSQSIQIE